MERGSERNREDANGARQVLIEMRSFTANRSVQTEGCGLLSSLTSNADTKVKLVQEGVIDQILDTMKAFPTSEKIQWHAVITLGNLMSDYNAVLGNKSAGDVLMAAILEFPGNEHIQNKACDIFLKLKTKRTTIKKIIDGMLVAMQKYPEFEPIQISACRILFSLTEHAENVKAVLIQKGAGMHIINALKTFPTSERLQCGAISLLENLARDSQVRLVLMRKGVDSILFRTILTFPEKERVLKHVIQLVASLAENPNHNVGLMGKGAGRQILRIMKKYPINEMIQISGCSALLHLACNRDTRVELMNMGAEVPILEAMRGYAGSEHLQALACGAVRNLAATAKHKKKLMTAGVDFLLLEAMRNFPGNDIIAKHCCGALKNLAATVENRVILMDKKADDFILRAMQWFPENAKIQQEGCGALGNLASIDEHKTRLRNKGADDQILDAMRMFPSIPSLQAYACYAISKFVVHDKKTMMKKDSHVLIVKAMKTFPEDELLQKNALCGLVYWVFNTDTSIVLIRTGVENQILKAMHTFATNPQIHSASISIQTKFLTPNLNGAAVLMPKETGVQILNCMVNFPENEGLQEKASHALLVLTAGISKSTSKYQRQFLQAEHKPILQGMIQFPENRNIQRTGWCLFAVISSFNEGFCMEPQAILRAMTKFPSDIQIQKATCKVWWNLAKNSDTPIKLMNQEACDPILNAMRHFSHDAHMHVGSIHRVW